MDVTGEREGEKRGILQLVREDFFKHTATEGSPNKTEMKQHFLCSERDSWRYNTLWLHFAYDCVLFVHTRSNLRDLAGLLNSLRQPEQWLCFYWIQLRQHAWGEHLKSLCIFPMPSWVMGMEEQKTGEIEVFNNGLTLFITVFLEVAYVSRTTLVPYLSCVFRVSGVLLHFSPPPCKYFLPIAFQVAGERNGKRCCYTS